MFRRFILYPLAGVGFLFVLITATPLVGWWTRALAGPWRDPKGEILIVLGGSVRDYETVGGSSYWRSMYALDIYREGGFQQVILSGSVVAPAMRDLLACYGVPRGAIRIEDESVSTRENALYVKKLLEGVPGRKVLLTSDFHMFRAHAAFSKAGLEVLPRPIPDVLKRAGPFRDRWSAFLDLTEETIKIGYYRAKGWI